MYVQLSHIQSEPYIVPILPPYWAFGMPNVYKLNLHSIVALILVRQIHIRHVASFFEMVWGDLDFKKYPY